MARNTVSAIVIFSLLFCAGLLVGRAAETPKSKTSETGKKTTSKAKPSMTSKGVASVEAKQEVDASTNSAQPSNAEPQNGVSKNTEDSPKGKKPEKIVKSLPEWKKTLKPEQFRVTRLKETEPPFMNKFWNNHRRGNYLCVCCDEVLYRSTEKFDSGTGWPSFWSAATKTAVDTETDTSLSEVRTEAVCSRCGAHLGHIFDDGPAPTGMRHCINSAALKFVPEAPAKTK